MLTTRVFDFSSGRFLFSKTQPFRCEISEDFPAVPALPETLLAMELQLCQRTVNLGEVSTAVLGDLGATIQILRLAGREYGEAENRPVRIEDCIADLGLETCLLAAERGTFARGALTPAVFELWAHSYQVALRCRQLAEDARGFTHPYEAYFAGLLHGIGSLPSLLGWKRPGIAADPAAAALAMAEKWCFPVCLMDYFGEVRNPGSNPQVSRIVAEAHRLAIGSSSRCPIADVAAHRAAPTIR